MTMRTTLVRYIRKGDKGDPAVNIVVGSETVVFTKSGQGAKVTIQVFIGDRQLSYGNGNNDTFVCSGLGESSYILDSNVYWSFKIENDNKTFNYLLSLQQKVDLSEIVPFTVTVNGIVYSKTLNIKTVYDGVDGTDGENSCNFILSQDNIVNRKSEYSSTYQLNANMYDGTQKVNANSFTVQPSSLPQGVSISGGLVDSYTYGFDVKIAAQSNVNGSIIFTANYGDITISKTLSITTVEAGAKGDRGATLRGPQDWSKISSSYQFYSGAAGEQYLDIVIYNDNYYICKKSHVKLPNLYPGSSLDNTYGYWQLGDKIELVATKVLLSQYAVIKNLGAEGITMKDKNGNVVFKAEEGNVTCKTGTFENVDVSGIVRAKLMYSTIKKLLATDADSSSPYYIDPVNDPCDTIFISTASDTQKWIYLPDAETYEGIELSFFHSVLTTMGLGSVYVSATRSQMISYNTTTSLIDGIIVTKKADGVGYEDTRIKLVYNEFTKLKAISGTWYVISGVVTEE